MPLARSTDEPCPYCGSSDTWLYEKPEGSITKEQYDCGSCGHEWTEVK